MRTFYPPDGRHLAGHITALCDSYAIYGGHAAGGSILDAI